MLSEVTMFCARCGQQIPEASEVCPLCGQSANLHFPPAETAPQPTAPSSVAPAAVPVGQRPINRQLKGVGGWLLFFCVMTTIVTPLGNLNGILSGIVQFSYWSIYHLAIVVFSFTAGINIWLENPSALSIARIYFVALAAFEALSIAVFFGLYGTNVIPLQIVYRVRTIIWVVIWFAYFYKSERVRATFGRNI